MCELNSELVCMPSRLVHSLRVIWQHAPEIAVADSLLHTVFFFLRALRDSRSAGAWIAFLSAFERSGVCHRHPSRLY